MYVQGLLLHAGVANFIRVSKGAWTMLIALFKVCTLLVTCTVAVFTHYMYSLHIYITCIRWPVGFLQQLLTSCLFIPKLLLAFVPACLLDKRETALSQ